jgi:hypothetical protein
MMADGSPVSFESRIDPPARWGTLRHSIAAPKASLRIEYDVRTQTVEFTNTGSETGFVFGYSESSLMAVCGRYLLMIPENVGAAKASIEFENVDPSLSALPPLKKRTNEICYMTAQLSDVVEAHYLAGGFEKFRRGYLEASMPAADKAILSAFFNEIEARAPEALGSASLVFLDKHAGGFDVLLPDTQRQLTRTWVHPGESRVSLFLEAALDAVFSEKTFDPDFLWYYKGLSRYFSRKLAGSFCEKLRIPRAAGDYNFVSSSEIKAFSHPLAQLSRIDPETQPNTYERMLKRATKLVSTIAQTYGRLDDEFDLLRDAIALGSAEMALKRVLQRTKLDLQALEHEVKPPELHKPQLNGVHAGHHSQPTTSTQNLDVLFTNGIEGYLENCGCSMSRSGGIAKEVRFVKEFRRSHANSVFIDLGNLMPVDGPVYLTPETAQQFSIYAEIATRLGYNALGIARNEIYNIESILTGSFFSRDRYLCVNLKRNSKSIFATSKTVRTDPPVFLVNVYDRASHTSKTPTFYEDRTFGYDVDLNFEDIQLALSQKPHDAIAIVFGYISGNTLRKLLDNVNGIDVVVWASEYGDEPWDFPHPHAGYYRNVLITPGRLGSYGLQVLELRLRGVRIKGFDVSYVELNGNHKEDAEVRREISRMYTEQYDQYRHGSMKPNIEENFVADTECKLCHTTQYSHWRHTKHAQAYLTLVEKRRNYAPECLSCHVVGFRLADVRIDQLKKYGGVQCESCHGPGKEHVNLRGNTKMPTLRTVEECETCHDAERSLNFRSRFGQAFKVVKH